MFKPLFAAAGLAVLALPIAAHAAPAGKFLGDAIRGDNSEVTLGRLATQRGHSPDVRRFGAMLVRDHSNAKVQAVAAARRDRVAVPGGMMPEAAAEYRKLNRLSGAAFDGEFKRYMIDDHRKDIAKFENQVRSGDRITSALARQTLPTLRTHLSTAQSLRI